jgi:hypothetical protein
MMLPELRNLDLSECLHVSGAEIVKGLSALEPRARLETLSFKSCTYIRVSVCAALSLTLL